jgi:hypothetical protein
MGRMYGDDVLAGNWRRRKVVPEVDAEPDLVVEDADSVADLGRRHVAG